MLVKCKACRERMVWGGGGGCLWRTEPVCLIYPVDSRACLFQIRACCQFLYRGVFVAFSLGTPLIQ